MLPPPLYPLPRGEGRWVVGQASAPLCQWCLGVLRGISRMLKRPCLQVAQKRSDTRRPKSRGMRRTVQYVAVTRDEGNAVDGRFSATCWGNKGGRSWWTSKFKKLTNGGGAFPRREKCGPKGWSMRMTK